VEVTYADNKIADIGKVSFNGSGNAILRTLPQTMGTLINPSLNPNRSMSVACNYFLQNKTKNQMEQIQYLMGNYFSSCPLPNRDLTVNENTYANVTIINNTFDIITNNTYCNFKLNVLMDHLQPFFDSKIPNTQVRTGTFEYNWVDAANVQHVTTFPIINNYEAAPSISFTKHSKPRNHLADGQTNSYIGGFHSIKLECWISGCLVKDMESYAANALIGPLGRQGTLSISGRTFEDAILNNFTSSEHNASNMRYTMEFISTQC